MPVEAGRRQVRPEVLPAKRVGVQAAAVDLHAQQFFQPDIAEPYLRSKVIEQGELAGLVGRLERHHIEAELIGEAIGQRAAEVSAFVEESDTLGALPRFHHQFAARPHPASGALARSVAPVVSALNAPPCFLPSSN